MDKYEFKATNLIAEKFEENDITYFVVNKYGREAVCVNFPVNCIFRLCRTICTDVKSQSRGR